MASGSLAGAAATEDGIRSANGLLPRPRIAAGCSWDCVSPSSPGGLADTLRLLPEGASDGETLAPPECGENAVVLERRLNDEKETSCLLYLQCDPHGSEEIVCVGILSEARNMEVYVGEEYCGTGRGQTVCTIQNDRNDKVTLYKKYLKLEYSTPSCRIKLLSIGERQRVLITKIVVQVKSVSAKSASDLPSLGSSIDLDRVQTMVESMGSKLSPGAQQLMNMVRLQQKNSFPLGDKLQCIFGKKESVCGDKHTIDGLHNAAAFRGLNQSSNAPFPFKSCLTTETVFEDLKTHTDVNTGRENIPDLERLKTMQQSTPLPGNDFKVKLSSLMQEQASANSNMPSSGLLLPFLQNLCSQVNHLQLDDGNKHFEKSTIAKGEGIQTVG
ncbi:WD repeat-containing protein 96 [Platysternon megacephalum]|uniref:WD repeat-containing protein 96 n=1 Tax=Platysternon megacephalum TaxID=55544 RepID=A0A4D9ECP1_9SAUR|nr:WD repeat-containing protein 96 [Platysternon megacephalum]